MSSAAYQSDDIAFVASENLNFIPRNLSVLVQEDSFLAAWDAQKYQRRLYCLNLDLIAGCYQYIDGFKATIPKICQYGEWKERQLRRIREALD
jgi:hypothetical protein